MPGLDKLILPGDDLTAADVASNFTSLQDTINFLKDENFEAGALNTRHFVPQSLASDGLDFKSMYRREFNETTITNSGYTEMVKLSLANDFPRLYGENSFVFVFAELEVYNTAVNSTPIGAAATEAFSLRLEFGQAVGTVSSYSSGAFRNETTRVITPGSAVAGVPAEVGNVVLFGVAGVLSASTHFDAKVTARSFAYDLTSNGSSPTNGRCKGAISALVVSR